jgi:charged multivesicular body protein 2A
MMAEFEKENAKTEMMQEVMGDAIDDALADDTMESEEQEQQIVNQVLDEIGISFGDELPEAANNLPASGDVVGVGNGKVAVGADDPALSELEARLNNLKR